MGGRGASGGGRLAGGGLNAGDITGLEDLVSMREGKPREIDEVLSVGKDVHDKYGEDIDNLSAATLKESKSGVNMQSKLDILSRYSSGQFHMRSNW